MRRKVWQVVAVSIVTGVLLGTGFDLTTSGPGSNGTASAESVTSIKITEKEFSFTPKTITVPAAPARFVLTNAGTIEHDFMIDALGVTSGMIKPGATVTIPPAGKPPVILKKGIYQAYCTVPGHKEAGMVLTITGK